MPTQAVQAQPLTNTSSTFIQFWKDVKAITLPYWYPTEPEGRAFSDVIRAWGMLTLLLLSIIAAVSVTAFNSFTNRNLVGVIVQEKDYSKQG
ncbi:hypothetical protein [Nostoc sp. 'Peltigera membranacea cyanobiont' 232]|uniref:hypothetical protein n=1 Tax=Nostoc sp. 'Peltigera membranacea cyanobiont' 232 TaxID=2014531 RepID=UPI00167B5215|nr:hypothetical protein [Nostoc sp. 'Peltigera membranacea cyanobiont' 232]